MVTALERDRSFASYALARLSRLGPAVLVVWIVAVLFMIAGRGTPGLLWFTVRPEPDGRLLSIYRADRLDVCSAQVRLCSPAASALPGLSTELALRSMRLFTDEVLPAIATLTLSDVPDGRRA